MTINTTSLSTENLKKLEKYVKDKFIPDQSENLSGGYWNEFKCGDVILRNSSFRIEIRIGNSELFSINTTENSVFKSLFTKDKDFHIDNWHKAQDDRASSILKNLS